MCCGTLSRLGLLEHREFEGSMTGGGRFFHTLRTSPVRGHQSAIWLTLLILWFPFITMTCAARLAAILRLTASGVFD